MSDLDAAFDEPAFVPYLCVGDPSVERTREYVKALERGGADVIELGLPFSEPIAEGPTIQASVVRALDAGVTPDVYFDFVESLDVEVPLVCMTYYNLIYQYGDEEGPEPFVKRAAEVGISGFVVPDLPAEESGPLREACDEYGLDLVFIVAPTTRGERLERMMEQTSGYVYVQARLGTTGARDDVSDQTADSLSRICQYDIPKAVGFGVSTGDHARRIVAGGADGVIVGSALVDIVAEHGDPEGDDVPQRLEEKARELAEGVRAGYAQGVPEPEGT
ncbi:tryptophan synthase subunit alpha [Haloarchaeobius amylolyticus]|uniref:tryptophan synthase subunit alpha n=1 Tax=Haloarchaeobius amylolyticus TaxID=1198296 RepID=UPI00226D7C1E|nr:tryptophan synthase subunit alpha [Haloarchaeobius amylolyticus]